MSPLLPRSMSMSCILVSIHNSERQRLNRIGRVVTKLAEAELSLEACESTSQLLELMHFVVAGVRYYKAWNQP
mgnify:CR=1